MENMEDFCVSHNYTQRDRLLFLRHPPPSSPPPYSSTAAVADAFLPLYMYIHCFFRFEKNHPEIVFFARDYASRDQIYHLTLRNTTVRTQTPLEYYTTYIYIYTHYMKIKGADNQG